MLSDYITQLEQVLSVERTQLIDINQPMLPRRRNLRVEFDSPQVGLMDYLAFRDCGLAPIIAERNSILGKVMVPSEDLLLDGRIILQLEYCLGTLEVQSDDQIVSLANHLLTQKLEQFPMYYWNATFASDELRTFWSPTAGPLGVKRNEDFSSSIVALQFLNDIPTALEESRWPTRQALQNHYKNLEQQELGGRLLNSLKISIQYIEVGNSMLKDAAINKTLCRQKSQKSELRKARDIMMDVYMGDVKSWFAKLNQYSHAVLAQSDLLSENQSLELRPKISIFLQDATSLFIQFIQVNRSHVSLWTELFKNCEENAVSMLPVSSIPTTALSNRADG